MKASAAGVVALLVAGCAGVSNAPPALPDARDTLVRVVRVPRPDNASEYMIPRSQVFVSATNFDRGALAGREETLAIRIDEIVVDRLREAHVGGASSDTPGVVALIPKARLVRDGDSAALLCTLEAQYSVGGMAHDFVHRDYSYSAPYPRKLVGTGDGWTDHEGAAFQAVVAAAFVKLTDAFIADWRGRLARENPVIVRFRRGDMKEPRTAAMLYDMGDFVAIAAGTAEAPRTRSVILIERAAVAR